MALTVEDGTCVADANAFVTREAFLAFAAEYYPAATFSDDETTDAAIMRTTPWLSSYPDWDGSMKCGRGLQGTAWPRTGVTDCAGETIPDDEVPVEVEWATFYGTMAEYASPGILNPSITPGKQKKSVKVDVIAESYMTPKEQGVSGSLDPVASLRPVLTAVNDALRCLASFPSGRAAPWPWVA